MLTIATTHTQARYSLPRVIKAFRQLYPNVRLELNQGSPHVNFQQLKIIREAARCDFNLTEVANTLFTSQSGVSRHIRDLEDELGVEIFIRRGKRLLGMTEPGKA
ncbi:hypothetical protein CRX72_20965, partial [Pantoea sp. BRM17]